MEFGGTRVDLATNLRIIRAVIYYTDVCVDTISYKSIDETKQGNTYLEFKLRRTNLRTSWIRNAYFRFFPPKAVLTYVPQNNNWILRNIPSLVESAPAEVQACEDAVQKLEDATPSRGQHVPDVYQNLVESQGNILWKYMPSSFEKHRTLAVHLGFMVLYFVLVTLGIVIPVITISTTYRNVWGIVMGIWVFYFLVIVISDTEYNDLITLDEVSVASFSSKVFCNGSVVKCLRVGSRVSRLSYDNVYPMRSFIYRTPNSTPTEYKFTRTLQAVLAKLFAYTDGSGGIYFPSNITVRVPNVLDLEWAILQKHYQAQPIAPPNTDSSV
jgi:hypothetical protein